MATLTEAARIAALEAENAANRRLIEALARAVVAMHDGAPPLRLPFSKAAGFHVEALRIDLNL